MSSISRRDLLGGAMAGLAGLAISGGSERADGAVQERNTAQTTARVRPRGQVGPLDLKTEPLIDAHSHIWTPDLDRYPLAEGFTRDDMQPASFTAEELLKTCRPLGVGRVNLIQMSYYGFDNSYMLDMIAAYPDRFVGTAIIDPEGVDPAAEMAKLASKGVRAFRVQPQFLNLPIDRWLDHPGYESMFSYASESKQAISFLIDPDALPEVDRVCRKYPETPFIVDHLARIGVDGEFREPEIEALCDLARNPNAYVKVGAFYALSPMGPPYRDLAPMIRRVVAAYGSHRCMWESDCPFQVVDHSYQASIDLIQSHLDFLDDDDRQWLLAGTAESLLFPAAN
ncbi:amidohydrolase family protein [Tautonia marina]|uniref:amidohydrolase family protein n=1 Tax=Tautonia marina TaxID=2653855 RepID=UPI001F35583B|nr:amidohydrolase family protein [Tautonia marina]